MNKRERIGALNEIISFQTYVEGRGKRGQVIKKWLTSNDVWSSVKFDTGKDAEETFIADRLSSEYIALFTVRLVEGMAPYMRIVHKKRHYNILLIAPLDRSYMVIKARSTEPEQETKYWTDPEGDTWTDPDGNEWEWIGDGTEEPDKVPFRSPGGFTWKDAQGNIFYQKP